MASTKKKKSTIQIPVNKYGCVPHYVDSPDYLARRIESANAEIAKGYKPESNCWAWHNEDEWKEYWENELSIWTFEWKDPWEFEDTFLIENYSRGRSAAIFLMSSQTNLDMNCTIFMSDMIDVIRKKTIKKGVVSGRWIFGKKGMNYGIRLAE